MPRLADIVPTPEPSRRPISKRARAMRKAAPPGSDEFERKRIESAVLEAAGCRTNDLPGSPEVKPDERPWGYIVATYSHADPPYAIVQVGYDGEGGYKRVGYSLDGDEVTTGDVTEMEQVFEPADEADGEPDEAEDDDDDVTGPA